MLASCSSERTANLENLRNALNKHYHHKQQRLCFSDSDFKFPRTISKKEKAGPTLIAKLNALHAAGLVSRRQTIKRLQGPGLGLKMEKASEYHLTGKGFASSKKIRVNKKWVRKFCYASPHAKEIVSFSKPETNKKNATTKVVYMLSLTKVSDWAQRKKLLLQFPKVKKQIELLKNPQRTQTVLHLGKERWLIKR